jgi:hypothetical protein
MNLLSEDAAPGPGAKWEKVPLKFKFSGAFESITKSSGFSLQFSTGPVVTVAAATAACQCNAGAGATL